MKKFVATIVAALLIVPPLATAVEDADFNMKTTRDLLDLCSAPENDVQYEAAMGYCIGYIDAAQDYHRSITSGDLLAPIACPDHHVTRQEMVDVFVAWAGNNGDLLDNESPINGVMRAATEKWPCE